MLSRAVWLFLLLPFGVKGMTDRPFACFYLRIHKVKTGDHCYTYIPSVQESFAVSFSVVSCPMARNKRDLVKKLIKGLAIEINLADDTSARAGKSKRMDRSKQDGIRALHELVQKVVAVPDGEPAVTFWKAVFFELDDWILAER